MGAGQADKPRRGRLFHGRGIDNGEQLGDADTIILECTLGRDGNYKRA